MIRRDILYNIGIFDIFIDFFLILKMLCEEKSYDITVQAKYCLNIF